MGEVHGDVWSHMAEVLVKRGRSITTNKKRGGGGEYGKIGGGGEGGVVVVWISPWSFGIQSRRHQVVCEVGGCVW